MQHPTTEEADYEMEDKNTDNNAGGNFAAIACQSCRKLHRKCDRRLPACLYCVKTGKQCLYPSPRRGKQFQKPKQNLSDGNNNFSEGTNHVMSSFADNCSTNSSSNSTGTTTITTTINPPSNSPHFSPYDTGKTQHELNYKYVANQSLDVYYNILSFGYPLIERERMQTLIDGKQKKLTLWQTKVDQEKDYGLLYAMQALCLQQLGHKDISNQLFQKGRQIIGKFFDDVDSISVPIAMEFMAEYLLGSGEKKKARVMSSTIRSNIESYLNGSTINSSGKTGSLAPGQVTNEMTLDSSWIDKDPRILRAVLVETHLQFIDLFLSEEEKPNTFIYEELEVLGHNKLKIDRSKVDESCRNMSEETFQKLLAIIKTYESYTDLVFNTMAKKDSLVQIVANLTNKQVHLEILSNCNPQILDVGEMLRVAHQIIELTKSPHFVYVPIFTVKAVILACSVRLKYNNQGLNACSIDFKDDLRALRVLSNRYSIIQKEYGQLIKTIESVLYTQSITQSHREVPFQFSIEDVNPFNSLIGSVSTSPEAAIIDLLNNGYQGSSYDDFFSGKLDNTESPNSSDIFANQILDSFYENNIYETRYRSIMEDVMKGSERFSAAIQNMIKQQQVQQNPDAFQRVEGLKKLRLELAQQMIEYSKKENDVGSTVEAEMFRRQVIATSQITQQYLQEQQSVQNQHSIPQFLIDDNNFVLEDFPFD